MERMEKMVVKSKKLTWLGEAVKVSASYQWATVRGLEWTGKRKDNDPDLLTIARQSQDDDREDKLRNAERKNKPETHVGGSFEGFGGNGIDG
jgi:hypothetical protein